MNPFVDPDTNLHHDRPTPCQRNPAPWFSDTVDAIAYAKAHCATCPTRLRCLQVALDDREAWGIWGGTTAAERRQMLGATDAA